MSSKPLLVYVQGLKAPVAQIWHGGMHYDSGNKKEKPYLSKHELTDDDLKGDLLPEGDKDRLSLMDYLQRKYPYDPDNKATPESPSAPKAPGPPIQGPNSDQ